MAFVENKADGLWDEAFAFLDGHPAGWALLEEAALAEFGRPSAWHYDRHEFLGRLAGHGGPRSLALARSLWRVAPESFAPESVVGFAERGAFEFERELRAWLDDPDARVEELLYAACFLHERGETDADWVLFEAAARTPTTPMEFEWGWLAATVLRRSGEDGPWTLIEDGLEGTVEGALEAGDLGMASGLVLAWDFYDELEDAAELRIGTLGFRRRAHAALRSPVLQSRSEIREALERRR